jgi:predicted enzyme related to lactoylglutathione lyase
MTAASVSITQVGRVVIPVSDPDRALEFYEGVLRLEKRMDVSFGANRWIEVAPIGQQTALALSRPPEGTPIGVETGVSFATDDADGDHAALTAAGVDVDEAVMRMGGAPPMFTFRDPDGNALRVVQTPAQ